MGSAAVLEAELTLWQTRSMAWNNPPPPGYWYVSCPFQDTLLFAGGSEACGERGLGGVVCRMQSNLG